MVDNQNPTTSRLVCKMNPIRNKPPSDDPSSYCRLCFSDRNLVSLFPNGEPPQFFLLDLIAALVGIQIDSSGADSSCSICWRCAVALEDFQLFRQRSYEHDAIVREKMSLFIEPSEHEEQEFLSSSFATSDETPQENGTSMQDLNQFNENAEISMNQQSDIMVPEFTCTLCYVEFSNHASLQKHLDKYHPELRTRAIANRVNNLTKRNNSRNSHSNVPRLRQLRNYQSPPSTATDNQCTTDNLFKCSYCPKSFKHGPSLHFHLKSHYNMLPFVCEFCDARFINEKGKLIHKGRYHFDNGVRKPSPPREIFKCKECNRNFVHRKYLWQHIRYKHPERCLPDGTDPTLIPIEIPNLGQSFENQTEDPLLEIKSEIDDSNSYCPQWD